MTNYKKASIARIERDIAEWLIEMRRDGMDQVYFGALFTDVHSTFGQVVDILEDKLDEQKRRREFKAVAERARWEGMRAARNA